MRLIDQYYKPETIDCYTFVFDEVTPETGYNTMLAMSEDGYVFSQWTSGVYDPEGENEHLGKHILLSAIGARALDGFFSRLSIPREWEEIHDAVEQIIREEDE
jgi:hypothetical protein